MGGAFNYFLLSKLWERRQSQLTTIFGKALQHLDVGRSDLLHADDWQVPGSNQFGIHTLGTDEHFLLDTI